VCPREKELVKICERVRCREKKERGIEKREEKLHRKEGE
jgi:hypothetical protein